MSTTPNRVFLARLVGLPVFDPLGDQVAKVRDVVVALRSDTTQPRVLGMVAEAESEAITLDPAELEDALWLSRDGLAQVMEGTHPRIRAPREGAIARWLLARWIEGI